MASDVDHIVPTLPKNFAHQRANILVEHRIILAIARV
jgi:hypothetical protein